MDLFIISKLLRRCKILQAASQELKKKKNERLEENCSVICLNPQVDN